MAGFPINIGVGGFVISSHLVFDLLAFYLGFRYYIYLRNRKGDFMDEDRRWILIIGAAVGALVFSTLLAALEDPTSFFSFSSWIFYVQGKTIVGGLLGGIIGVEITKKIVREKRASGDLFTYPLILGISIGRIGCFLTGVSDRTVGLPSALPWAFDQGDGIPRHPTSLYEILFLLLLWSVLIFFEKRVRLKNGNVFKIFTFSYLLFRFFIEFIKPTYPMAFGLSAIQIASLLGVVYFGIALYKNGVIEDGKN